MSVILPVMNRTVQGYLHMTHEWSQFTHHIRSMLPPTKRRAAFLQLVDQELLKFQGKFVLDDTHPIGVELIAAWVEFPDEEHMWSFRLAWS
jgi:hypothetical protein